MKSHILLLALSGLSALTALADSTIDATAKYAYGANIGWTNWKHDLPAAPEGAVIGLQFCSGYIYGANVGWIDIGDGSPVNGTNYQNNSATDYGVNVENIDTDANTAELVGNAYGANIGWITFEQTYGDPKINLMNGEFSGYAYSANCGWISLANGAQPALKTGTLDEGPDSDGDMIPDWWELEQVLAAGMTTGTQAGDLLLLSDTTDVDGDGADDLEEFAADSDPFDNGDYFAIIDFVINDFLTGDIHLEWTSSTTRLYDIEQVLLPGTAPLAANLVPDPGTTTALDVILGPLPPRGFTRIVAKPPLGP